ncbi:MAG: hypothetical protein AB8G95_27210 [Anaerolineae bacterium]
MRLLANRKTWTLGFLTWLIPFLIAIPFFDQSGELAADIFTFKATMSLVYTIVSASLVARILQDVNSDFLKTGLILGVIWTALNIGLDLIVLVGLFGNELSMWFWRTGIGYFNMIPLGLAMGWLLAKKLE